VPGILSKGRRQATGETARETSDWIRATHSSASEASTELLVRLGQAHWDIENQGVNELTHAWHAGHLFRHHPNAIDAFTLVAFLAYQLFPAGLALNLKPALRDGKTDSFWAFLMAAETYGDAEPSLTARSP